MKFRKYKCSDADFIKAVELSKTKKQVGEILGLKAPLAYDFYGKVKELNLNISHFHRKIGRLEVAEGTKINRWTLIKKINDNYKWICRCDCGKEYIRNVNQIVSNRSKSCGCKRYNCIENKEKLLFPVSTFEEFEPVYTKLKCRARFSGRKFTVSAKYLWDLYLKQNKKCSLTGQLINIYRTNVTKKLNKASLDRIDSSLDYIEGNVQWVEVRINKMKSNMTEFEFIDRCRLVYENKVKNESN